MTTRRGVLVGLGAARLTPLAFAAAPEPLIGVLIGDPDEGDFRETTARIASALESVGAPRLRFETRGGTGPVALRDAARELVATRPAVIVTYGEVAARVASAAGPSIPVIAMVDDAVGAGLAVDLKRPARNITGVSVMTAELDAKRLEILAELIPRESSVLLLADRTTTRISRPQLEAVGRRLKVRLLEVNVSTGPEVAAALTQAKRDGIAGINVLGSLFLFQQTAQIIATASELALPVMYVLSAQVDQGGLISYGPDTPDLYRQFAEAILKAVRGGRAQEIPFVQPNRFKLAINLKTARALRLSVPQSLLLRADSLIQ